MLGRLRDRLRFDCHHSGQTADRRIRRLVFQVRSFYQSHKSMFKPAISELRAHWLRLAANCGVFGVHIGHFRLTSNNKALTTITYKLVVRPV